MWAERNRGVQFTRTGSTDEALSFTLASFRKRRDRYAHVQCRESSFSNYHWAI